ncbi:hypothetical protein [Pseudomonas fluorescens]|uniref:hypothetical protein n=1 Tax=Pseudomonas fluorescens TaxID=294 RepID=UPI00123F7BD8|nr:hypothetical protein [Pseudomonas fluorescens]VVP02660.1 hypothetical protein PS898_02892 [Pseudomonas fluorescens]
MDFAPPELPQFLPHTPETATVNLSALSDELIIQVPDSRDFAANWSVYAILGDDPEEPEWASEEVNTGTWDDAEDEMEKLTGIELHIPKEVLLSYLHSEIELRYKFQDESSLEPYSEPLLLRIEA